MADSFAKIKVAQGWGPSNAAGYAINDGDPHLMSKLPAMVPDSPPEEIEQCTIRQWNFG
jgi:hypothetical protein